MRKTVLFDSELPETEYVEDILDDIEDEVENYELAETYLFQNGTEIVKKKNTNVLRWVHFDIETDSKKHFRELLILFKPWRHEKELMSTFTSLEDSYLSCKDVIEKKRSEFESGACVSNEISDILLGIECDLNLDSVAPENEHQEQIDIEDVVRLSTQYGCFDPGKDAPVYDVGVDLGISRRQIGHEELLLCGELDDIQYRNLIRRLNQQQRDFFIMFYIG